MQVLEQAIQMYEVSGEASRVNSYGGLYELLSGNSGGGGFGGGSWGGGIKPTIKGAIIPYGDLTGLGGDVHDTLKIDIGGDILNGHTTIFIPGYNKHRIDHEK